MKKSLRLRIPEGATIKTAADYQRYINPVNVKTYTNKKVSSKKKTDTGKYERKIKEAFDNAGIKYEKQKKLIPGRKFRVDFFVEPNIVIEFEGGIFIGGRHTRGTGYANDCKKYRMLTLLGYVVLRYSSICISGKNGEYKIIEDINILRNAKK